LHEYPFGEKLGEGFDLELGLRDPERVVYVAEPALALLDVGFEEIYGPSETVYPAFVFRYFLLNEFMRYGREKLGKELFVQIEVEPLVPGYVPRIQERGQYSGILVLG